MSLRQPSPYQDVPSIASNSTVALPPNTKVSEMFYHAPLEEMDNIDLATWAYCRQEEARRAADMAEKAKRILRGRMGNAPELEHPGLYVRRSHLWPGVSITAKPVGQEPAPGPQGELSQ
jgi:hypothetical protein